MVHIVYLKANLVHDDTYHSQITMDNANGVFVYTGTGGAAVPQDVVRVLVDPSVTCIPQKLFAERNNLAEVDLCAV